MAKNFKLFATLSFIITVLMAAGYMATRQDVLLTLAITFGTIAYHLIMRLALSFVFNSTMHNRADLNKSWYRTGKGEMAFYEKLNVRRLNRKMPTYDSSLFDPRLHSWSEIAQAMCQAELIHETAVALSFLPIIAGTWFGAYPVFIITSIVAAAFDAVFVVMQRYNRGRILRGMGRKK